MELRVKLDDEMINQLKAKLNVSSNKELIAASLSLLDWAADESLQNRSILSTNSAGKEVEKMIMPQLKNYRKNA